MKLIYLLVSLSIVSTSLMATEATSEKQANDAVEFRQSIFKLIKSNVGPLGGMARGKVAYDAEVVKKNAVRLNQLSLMLPDYFALDTSAFPLETEALDVIWEEGSEFSSKAAALQDATSALVKVSNSGDEGAVKDAIGDMFKTCKSCHDDYRED